MSFGIPSLFPASGIPNQCVINDDSYEVPKPMVSGLWSSQRFGTFSHPLDASESQYRKNEERRNMVALRNTQGLHAPMRLAMEIKAAEKIGRLPFLPSSHLMNDVLLGRDEEIGFEDVLNTAEFREQMGQPHAIVERSLGIL